LKATICTLVSFIGACAFYLGGWLLGQIREVPPTVATPVVVSGLIGILGGALCFLLIIAAMRSRE